MILEIVKITDEYGYHAAVTIPIVVEHGHSTD
jgi:hypothetical protein